MYPAISNINSPQLYGITAYKSSNIVKHKKFFDKLSAKLGLKHWEDWYCVKWKEVIENGGGALIRKHYQNSHIKALSTVYPENDWKVWKFNQVSPKFWRDVRNHKTFFNQLANELGLKSWEGWYSVSLLEVNSHGGRGLLSTHYGDSLHKALTSIYPELPWQKSRFKTTVHGKWNQLSTQRLFFEQIADKLQIQNKMEWNSITINDIYNNGGKSILLHYFKGSLHSALHQLFPEHYWPSILSFSNPKIQLHTKLNLSSSSKLSTKQSKAINRIHFFLSTYLFPSRDVHVNYSISSEEFRFKTSNIIMEFDFYIPSLKLAIEYQGKQHIKDSNMFGNALTQKQRDVEKLEACKSNGIICIQIPMYWDGSLSSLSDIVRANGVSVDNLIYFRN